MEPFKGSRLHCEALDIHIEAQAALKAVRKNGMGPSPGVGPESFSIDLGYRKTDVAKPIRNLRLGWDHLPFLVHWDRITCLVPVFVDAPEYTEVTLWGSSQDSCRMIQRPLPVAEWINIQPYFGYVLPVWGLLKYDSSKALLIYVPQGLF